MYPSGFKVKPGKRSYGYGGGGGGGYGPPAPPSVPGAPTAPTWQRLTLTGFNSTLARVKAKLPDLDATIGLLFGSSVLSALLAFLALSDADRAAWLADPANAAMIAAFNRFMAWFAAQEQAAQAATPPLMPAGRRLWVSTVCAPRSVSYGCGPGPRGRRRSRTSKRSVRVMVDLVNPAGVLDDEAQVLEGETEPTATPTEKEPTQSRRSRRAAWQAVTEATKTQAQLVMNRPSGRRTCRR